MRGHYYFEDCKKCNANSSVLVSETDKGTIKQKCDKCKKKPLKK